MQTIEYMPIGLLKPHPDNPRKVDEMQMDILCASLKENQDYFETRPILCNKDYVVFAGNMRLRAAERIGMEKVPVAVMDISEARQRELMIRDNRSNGTWDFDLLNSNFDTSELLMWGFTKIELTGVEDFSGGSSGGGDSNKKELSNCPKCGYDLKNGAE